MQISFFYTCQQKWEHTQIKKNFFLCCSGINIPTNIRKFLEHEMNGIHKIYVELSHTALHVHANVYNQTHTCTFCTSLLPNRDVDLHVVCDSV